MSDGGEDHGLAELANETSQTVGCLTVGCLTKCLTKWESGEGVPELLLDYRRELPRRDHAVPAFAPSSIIQQRIVLHTEGAVEGGEQARNGQRRVCPVRQREGGHHKPDPMP